MIIRNLADAFFKFCRVLEFIRVFYNEVMEVVVCINISWFAVGVSEDYGEGTTSSFKLKLRKCK